VGTAQFVDGEAILYVRLSKGKHTFTASYGGDDNFLTSLSAPVTITL
jgi:hypothetical protein